MTITKTSYTNNNYRVIIYPDGTKVRYTLKEEFKPLFPEAVDLKITNRCFNNCKHCHELSTPSGLHALLPNIKHLLKELPPGVEIAIGGGDPLTHPLLPFIVGYIRGLGLIPNLTVNALSLKTGDELKELSSYLGGVGISFSPAKKCQIEKALTPSTVVHFIAGLDSIKDAYHYPKRLILGFKKHGRASNLEPPLMEQWIREIHLLILAPGITCFDTLALEQLRLKDLISPQTWASTYMGSDGEFTMYIDAVSMAYGISSISKTFPLHFLNIREAFSTLRSLPNDQI